MARRIEPVCDFQVIDESENWIIVNKPAPLIVHPTDKKGQPTLLGGVQALLRYELINGASLSIINRLDRETSGVVIFSKNRTWARYFNRCIERRLFKKTYNALVFGQPEWEECSVTAPLTNQRDFSPSPIWLKQAVHPSGKTSKTDFKVLQRYQKFSVLEARPHTGRMHQIRVHLAHLGHPILGDKLYGKKEQYYLDYMEKGWTEEMEKDLYLPRQALHASNMQLSDSDAQFSVDWHAPLASDLLAFINEHENAKK